VLRILVIIAALFLAPFAEGTEFVLLYNPSVTIIGLDSLGYDSQYGLSQNFCKIHKDGELFWTSTGIYHSSGFDLSKIVAESAKKKLTPKMTVEDAASSMLKPLQAAYQDIKANDPKTYEYMKKLSENRFLQVYFFWQESGRVVYAVKDFDVVGNNIQNPKTSFDCSHAPSTQFCMFVSGVSPDANVWAREHAVKMDTKEDIINYINTLMKMGKESFPESVGPPYSILEVRPTGYLWLQMGLCSF
jgi:hypothetical protein